MIKGHGYGKAIGFFLCCLCKKFAHVVNKSTRKYKGRAICKNCRLKEAV